MCLMGGGKCQLNTGLKLAQDIGDSTSRMLPVIVFLILRCPRPLWLSWAGEALQVLLKPYLWVEGSGSNNRKRVWHSAWINLMKLMIRWIQYYTLNAFASLFAPTRANKHPRKNTHNCYPHTVTQRLSTKEWNETPYFMAKWVTTEANPKGGPPYPITIHM